MNYFDILLAKKLEDDRDPKVEGLSVSENGRYHEDGVVYDPVIVNVPQTPLSKLTVTENGTYTAPSGTAYNEVDVNVPLPENAYLLKDIENTPTAIATFSDGANLPMPKLEVGIEPVQEGSGDPSPENIRPISGWDEVNVSVSGVNVWDEEWEVGSIADSNGQNATNSNYRRSKNYISVKTNKRYYFNVPNKYGTTYRFYQYKQNKDYIGVKAVDSDGTFETDNDCAFIRFRIATTEEYTNDISINYPSTDTSYHAYNEQTYTIDLDGTRYGGKVDLVSGVMTITHGYVKLTDPDYNWQSGIWGGGYRYYTTNRITDAKNNQSCQSSIYKAVTRFTEEKGIAIDTAGNTNQIDVRTPDFTSLANWKSFLASNPVDVRYELATPFTVQLSPTQVKSLQINNVWADSGDILDLSYFSKEV